MLCIFISQVEESTARQHRDVAGLVDGEHPEPDQVRHAQPLLQAQGREGHAEIREGEAAQAENSSGKQASGNTSY